MAAAFFVRRKILLMFSKAFLLLRSSRDRSNGGPTSRETVSKQKLFLFSRDLRL
jgi:hypothetical protein